MKILGIIAISAALAFSIGLPQSSAHEEDETIVIHMYDDRYEPADIVIPQGGKVLFESVEGTHWPASNIHPTHRAYPNSGIEKCDTNKSIGIFDACVALEPGANFEFTFNHAGEWRYHDHINPNLTGSILVEEVDGFVTPESESGFSLEEKYQSFKFWFTRMYYRIFPSKLAKAFAQIKVFDIAVDEIQLSYWLKLVGAESVMDKLLEESGGGTTIDCHDEAHQVGREAYALFSGEAFEEGDAACHSGYYHGAMETFLSERGTANLDEDIAELCSIFESRFGEFECLHGVGHGVMAYNGYNLPGSLKECQKLNSSFAQSSCYGGAFMENVVAGQGSGALLGHETEWVSNDPLYPCNAIDQNFEVQYQCYQMQTSWMLTIKKYDFDTVSDECTKVPANMVSVCFRSLGRDAAGHTLRNPTRMLSICQGAPEAYFRECMEGGLNVIVDFWGDGLGGQASEFCSIIPQEHKAQCYGTLAGRLGGLFSDSEDRLTVCNTFESEYDYLCNS